VLSGAGPTLTGPELLEPNMPKMKSNRAACKRFKITGSGRVRRASGGASHGFIGKSRKRRRRLRDNAMVAPEWEKRIKNLMPYA
jgi:large subunit ribosomal protein L35